MSVLATTRGDVMTSMLMCTTLDQAVCIGALARDTVSCCWERHFTLSVPLSTQVQMGISKFNAGRQHYDGLESDPGGIRKTTSHSTPLKMEIRASLMGNLDQMLT